MIKHITNLKACMLPLTAAAVLLLAVCASGASAQARNGWNTDTNGHDRYIYKPNTDKPYEPSEPDSSPSALELTLAARERREREADAQAERNAQERAEREKASEESARKAEIEAAREAARQAEIDAENARALAARKQAAMAKYASIGPHRNLALVSLRVGKAVLYGYINEDYDEVIAPQFSAASDFDGYSAIVVKDGKTTRIDRSRVLGLRR